MGDSREKDMVDSSGNTVDIVDSSGNIVERAGGKIWVAVSRGIMGHGVGAGVGYGVGVGVGGLKGSRSSYR